MVKVLTKGRLGQKKGSLVSGNWPGKNVFLTYLPHIFKCVSEYTLFVPKKDITNTQKQKKIN